MKKYGDPEKHYPIVRSEIPITREEKRWAMGFNKRFTPGNAMPHKGDCRIASTEDDKDVEAPVDCVRALNQSSVAQNVRMFATIQFSLSLLEI